MKIVVIGGTGLIGSKTVAILRKARHEAVAASPKNGINSITGEGLKEAMAGTGCRGRSRQFALVRRQGRAGVLRNLGAQSSGGGEAAAGVEAPCRAVDRRN